MREIFFREILSPWESAEFQFGLLPAYGARYFSQAAQAAGQSSFCARKIASR